MKTTILCFALLLAGCSQEPLPRYGIMHRPLGGCPEGYVERKAFFSERDGTTEDACAAKDGTPNNGTIDMLKSGEGMMLSIPINIVPDTSTNSKI